VATFPVAPEVLTAYEFGSKNRFMDNKLQVNGALYYYHYGAYQLNNVNIAPLARRRNLLHWVCLWKCLVASSKPFIR